jgi:hypothetical protein
VDGSVEAAPGSAVQRHHFGELPRKPDREKLAKLPGAQLTDRLVRFNISTDESSRRSQRPSSSRAKPPIAVALAKAQFAWATAPCREPRTWCGRFRHASAQNNLRP